jgi:hypothetical protein
MNEEHAIFSFFEHPRKMRKSQIFNFSGPETSRKRDKIHQ